MNLTEIIRRINHFTEGDLPHTQSKELAVELFKRQEQLIHLIGDDRAGKFTLAVQHLDAARKLTGMTMQRLDACRTALHEATATLRR